MKRKTGWAWRGALLAAACCVAGPGALAAEEAASPTSQCVDVPANVEWLHTGIRVNPGLFICVGGDGLWSHGGQGVEQLYPYYGPEGYGKDAAENPDQVLHIGALAGKIDNNYPFLIRWPTCFIPKISGELRLAMDDAPGTYGNNDGVMHVRVLTWPASARPERLSYNVFRTCPSGPK